MTCPETWGVSRPSEGAAGERVSGVGLFSTLPSVPLTGGMSDQLAWFLTFCIWGGSAGGTDGGGISVARLSRIGGGGGGPDSIESAGGGGAGIAGRTGGSCIYGHVVICGSIDPFGGRGGLGFVATAVSATAEDCEFAPSANAVSATAGD